MKEPHKKGLNAGIIEDGEWPETEKGTPQGAVISPLLANIYLHYVLDQCTDQWRQSAQGDVIIVRYADDAVIGFQHEYEAKQFLHDLREQLGKYGLEMNEEKTRLIRFGRFARQNRDERGEGKAESFTFLGFQHICAENSLGRFEVRRITDGVRRRKKLQEIKQQIRWKMHEPVAQAGGWLRSVLNGYYQYHAVPGNLTVLKRFRKAVELTSGDLPFVLESGLRMERSILTGRQKSAEGVLGTRVLKARTVPARG